jgi:hypothetical protein
MNQIEDRIALKELVDMYAIYGDQKKMPDQAALFSENGIVELYSGTVLTAPLKGRLEIENTFTAFLNNFESAYHFNGQQTVTINNNTATGIAYCTVTLIGDENDIKFKTTIGVHYHDEYIKVDNKWLIDKRKSYFGWQHKQPLMHT